jgi:hypothetical protein
MSLIEAAAEIYIAKFILFENISSNNSSFSSLSNKKFIFSPFPTFLVKIKLVLLIVPKEDDANYIKNQHSGPNPVYSRILYIKSSFGSINPFLAYILSS